MPSKPQSKEIEDILHAIQDRLFAIQIHMESQKQRQDAIETKQESLQPSLSALLEQVSSLTPPGSSSTSIPYIPPIPCPSTLLHDHDNTTSSPFSCCSPTTTD